MIEWLFTCLVLYLLYKLIFDFIVPVTKASAQVRSHINEMNKQQKQQQFNANKTFTKQPEQPKRSSKDDYIDFEEVK